jgi:cytidyltransferase-like protein
MNEPASVVVSGSFDDLRTSHVRLLQEAANFGPVHVALWSDEIVRRFDGKGPKFSEAERLYLLESIRYVDRVTLSSTLSDPDALPSELVKTNKPSAWIVEQTGDTPGKRAYCRANTLEYRVLNPESLLGYTPVKTDCSQKSPAPKRVIVSGCFDWFHSGHVRFFEEVCEFGDLYVIVGHDANIRLLKGEGHPLFNENERQYLVQAVRFVKQALVSTGNGWLDAEPEIVKIKPHIYAVNEDGDRPEKRQYCESYGIEYRVLKRSPKQGLPKRQSTCLRGF